MCLQLIGYTYSVTLECYPTACLGLWLCHKLMADVFFLSETINDLTFGAGVSYISLTHTPGSAPGKLSL